MWVVTWGYSKLFPTLAGWTWTRLGISFCFSFLLVRIYYSFTIPILSFLESEKTPNNWIIRCHSCFRGTETDWDVSICVCWRHLEFYIKEYFTLCSNFWRFRRLVSPDPTVERSSQVKRCYLERISSRGWNSKYRICKAEISQVGGVLIFPVSWTSDLFLRETNKYIDTK